ncbi:MAG TPA: helix-turn-helix domain-containing protein [Candidatus Obscuribacter sp.]|nr:helix-turn-helix domain-containing protein [Candidatus Obscuribacter sp.]MBK9279489.1 helix-turn-helix domain-containing protein [Candidatus Obscuribacter sp.]MBL8081435.1 helix-turn-helix domain-containing protein [Candidatus Obscuribacter sp.]HND66537.1 helix-turn-helix domain-containing protein [Candidatus Obscuribacter sp.]
MSLEQVGQKLKAAREAQNLSLGQVYDRTRIPTNHLEAIEFGRVEDLPEPVYVAGFIKRYGDTLGLSGQALADEYKRAGMSDGQNKPGIFGIGKGRETPPPTVSYVAPTHVISDAPSFTKTFFYPSLLLVAVLASVCALGWWQQSQLSQQDPGVLQLRDSATRFNAAGMQVAATTSQLPNAQVPGVLPASTGKITLSATQHVWVEVKSVSSGSTVFVGYLESGDKRDFEDAQGLTVIAGNGASLSVTDYLGKTEVFGPAGRRKESTFTPPQAATSTQVATGDPAQASTTTTTVKPVTNVKRTISLRRASSDGAPVSERRHRRLDDGGTRDIPGVSSGGGARSIDVPYRYNDGRLDND